MVEPIGCGSSGSEDHFSEELEESAWLDLDSRGYLGAALHARGLTRRDFLKGCAGMAVMLGLGRAAVPDIVQAVEHAAAKPPVVWVDWQECLGCTESITKSRNPDFVNVVLDLVSVEYHEALMAGAGESAERNFRDTVEGRAGEYVLVVEGSVATEIENAMTIGGRTSVEIAREVIPNAAAVIAIGNCASFGNVQAAHPNPTGAMGMQAFMEREGMDTSKLLQLSTCPVNPTRFTSMVIYYLTYGRLPETDRWRRPLIHFGQKVHDLCERRSHFDEGRFVEVIGDAGEYDRYCLYKVGCRGPSSFADCPRVLYNGHTSWCVEAGQCIGCSEKDFWDELTDFYQPLPGVAIPGFGGIRTDADTVGIGLAAATGVAIAAHLGVSAAKGRLGQSRERDIVVEERDV